MAVEQIIHDGIRNHRDLLSQDKHSILLEANWLLLGVPRWGRA